MSRRSEGRTSSPTLAIFTAVLLAIVIGGVLLVTILPWVSDFVTARPPAPPAQQPPVVVGPQPQAPPGRIQLQVQDIDTGAALGGTNARIDVVDPADLTKPREIIIVDTTTRVGTSALLYQPGQRLLLHIFSSEGSGYYPMTYEVTVPSTYSLVANQYIYFLGSFGLKQRVAAADARFTLFLGATSLSSGTGNTAGSQGTANAPSKVFELNIQINLMAYRVAFGDNVDYIDARYQRITLKPIVWIALNQTGVSSTEFINRGWNPVTTTAVTGWLVFYRVIEPVRSTQTALGSLSLPVRVDASSLPTNARIRFLVWIADLQNEDAARSGVGTTSLPAYGGYSGYGLTSPLGFAFQSSGGSPTNPLLAAVITVP